MRGFLRYLCLLALLLSQACTAGGELPVETPTISPHASPQPSTPLPSLTATLPPSPLPPTLTPTSLPPTLPPTATPTEIPLIYAPEGNLIQPSSGAGEWLWYDSPHWVTALLFDGTSMWAGSRHGGLVQWDPQTLTAVRHTHATGFPLRTVNDLAFDAPSGFLYAAGDEGLAVWDGQRWQAFTPAQLGFLPNNPLRAVAVEAGTTIWVGADEAPPAPCSFEPVDLGGGLVRGDWQQGSWEQFNTRDLLLGNQVTDLVVAADGSLWLTSVGYFTGGVSHRTLDGSWQHWGQAQASFDFQGDRGLAGYAFYSLVISPAGTVYAGGPDGVSGLEPGANEWRSLEILSVHQIALGADGRLWAAAREGLFLLSGTDGVMRVYRQSEPYALDVIALDGNGNVWLGGANGLFRLQGANLSQLFVPDALPRSAVYSVAVNGDDTIWLRSDGFVSHLVGDRIFTYASESHAIEAAYPWTGRNSLWRISPDGTLWLLEQAVLRGYNASGWQSVALELADDDYVQDFVAGANGLLVVAAQRTGLYIYLPGQGWRLEPFPTRNPDFIGQLLYDPRTHSLWANLSDGNFYNGDVWRYDLSAEEWTDLSHEPGSIPRVWFSGLNLSPLGEMWAVNAQGNVAVRNTAGEWRYITHSPEFLGWSGFGMIYFGNRNDEWLVTVELGCAEGFIFDGLAYYNNRIWRWFTAENSSLISEGIYDLSVDSQGNAWLATDSGLQRIPIP